MRKGVYHFIITICGLLLFGSTVWAQGGDAPGSEDHPLVTRYTGSFIDGYEVREFDEYVLALGPAVWNADRVRVPEESELLEGRITRIIYRGPQERSSLEILRNYQAALEGAGFEILYTCGSDCGNNFPGLLYGPTELRIKNSDTSGSAFDLPQDVRYLAAKMTSGNREVHVSVLTAFDNGFSDLSKQPVTLLEVIESQSMDTGMVVVDADAIGKGLDATGHMAIYGILFDTNSATIKPESGPVLTEIAALLKNRPDLQLLVVGHTDDEGGFAYNMNLSKQRAGSVLDYLSDKHGIDKARLQAEGVGYLAPVTTNETPAGRSQNRRVELVKGR